ncbi:MAG: T9SS type A sorting domain-containing protein [Bacteroidota bacterium]
MRTLFIFLLSALSSLSLMQAQNFQWVNQMGAPNGWEYTTQVDADSSGYSYVVGNFFGTVSFGSTTLTASSSSDMFVARLDPNGAYEWVRQVNTVGSTTTELCVDKFGGNVYVAGNYWSGTIDFDGITINSSGGSGAYIAKYDALGVIQWVEEIPNGIAVGGLDTDAQDNLIVAGSYYDVVTIGTTSLPHNGNTQYVSIFLAKYTTNGLPLWAEPIETISLGNGLGSYVSDLQISPQGDIAVTGIFGSESVFGSDTLYSIQDSGDMFVAKYDDNGNYLWAKDTDATGHVQPGGISVGESGAIYVTGFFTNQTSFGPITLDNMGWNNIFVARYASNGEVDWAIREGSSGFSKGCDIWTDATEHVYVVGEYEGTNDIGDTTLLTPFNKANLFVARYDSTASFEWIQTAGDSVGYISCYAMAMDDSLNIYVAGAFSNAVNFGPFPVSTNNTGTAWDGFLLRMNDITPYIYPPDSVWPGDANYDLIANYNDLLSIGIGFGSTGAVRPNASINWIGQVANNWADTLLNGTNYKHIDCNGDGVINIQDTLAINLNYGLTHNKRDGDEKNGPLLYTEFVGDTIMAGDTVDVIINLGTDQEPAVDLYGIAFTLQYDSSLVEPNSISVSYDNSWLGTYGSDMIAMSKNFPLDESMDFGLTRINHLDTTDFGEIARLSIIMIDDLTAKTLLSEVLTITPVSYQAISSDESSIDLSLGADSIVIVQEEETDPTAIDPSLNALATIYPNPVQDELMIQLTGIQGEGIEIRNALGQSLYRQQVRFVEKKINLSEFPDGLYLLEILTERGKIIKKILVQ